MKTNLGREGWGGGISLCHTHKLGVLFKIIKSVTNFQILYESPLPWRVAACLSVDFTDLHSEEVWKFKGTVKMGSCRLLLVDIKL